jgi:AcrR family transcriptional regulator
MNNQQRRERTRLALVSAAAECLQEVGYGRLRTADVARRAGLSEGSLFRSFPTKLDLVAATLEFAAGRHRDRIVSQFLELPRPLGYRDLLYMMWRLLSHLELAWTYELASAASTDAELRNVISPVLDANTEAVDHFAISVLNELSIPETDIVKAFNLVTWTMQSLVLRDLGRGPSGQEHELISFLLVAAERVYGINS